MSAGKIAPKRRIAVGAAAAIFAVSAGAGVLASVPRDGDIGFKVLRGDSPLGDHQLSFDQAGEKLQVKVDIDLEVNFGPFTVYEYLHDNREVWRDGRLISLTSETDDNGEDYFVRAEQTAEGLRIETKTGVEMAPADIVPTSYWNYEIVQASKVLDTQKGRIMEVSTELVGPDEVWVDGRAIPARHYRMTGDLNIELWYDADNEWVKTAFEIRGEQIEYFRGGVPEDFDQASFFSRQRGGEAVPFDDLQRTAR